LKNLNIEVKISKMKCRIREIEVGDMSRSGETDFMVEGGRPLEDDVQA
jgi:hypothetical protein